MIRAALMILACLAVGITAIGAHTDPVTARQQHMKDASKNRALERTGIAECLRQWFDGALDLLRLVSGMLRVASPSNLNERYWRTKGLRCASALQNEIQIVLVAVEVQPRAFLAATARPRPTAVQIQIVLARELFEQRQDSRFENVSDNLSESVRW